MWVALESQTEMRVTAKQCVGGLGDSHCERGARGCWRRRVKGREGLQRLHGSERTMKELTDVVGEHAGSAILAACDWGIQRRKVEGPSARLSPGLAMNLRFHNLPTPHPTPNPHPTLTPRVS